MWEKLVNCIKGGGAKNKSCQVVQLVDLVKQVPPNQLKMFQIFTKKHEEYKDRVRKYPESMPTIDWEYYRQNVREEFVEWVKGYETKYDKLHSLFENRHAIVDHKRYFDIVDAEAEEVKKAISAYKAESNERIKKLNEQLEFLKAMQPYENMTMEEFCIARPHLAPDFLNKPTFWPHTPEEQVPGPADPEAAAALHEDHKPEPPKKPMPPPEKPPEKGSGDAKPSAAAAPKEPAEPLVDTTQLAEKATVLAKDLVARAIVLFNILKVKVSGLAKNVQKKADAAKAARAEAAGKSKPVESTSTPAKSLDSITERESGPNICNQTIIRSEEGEANPEVKARHANLSIEADPCDALEERTREIARALERKRQLREAEEWACRPKEDPCKPKVEEDVCEEEKDTCKPDPCELKEEEEACEPDPCKPDPCKPDPCKPKDEEPICEDEDPCKKNPKEENECKFDTKNPKEQEQIFINIAECSKDLVKKEEDSGKPKEKASLMQTVEGIDQKPIIGLQLTESKEAKKDEKGSIDGTVYTDPNQIVELLEQEKQAKELKAKESLAEVKMPEDGKPVTIYPKLEISAKPKLEPTDDAKNSPKDMAKQVFNMATGAASLLTEATNTLEDLKKKKEDRLEALEQAYTSAQRQAQGALAEASRAVDAAKKLAQRSVEKTGEISSSDQEALDMAQKHAALAKMLASRAVALKDEIARVLNDLKKKE
ncbi:titin [Drosophila elegans]|uniref:titin n=1 Tax=Drosophila elegans TaxID=30023 RepID=UPI0007E6903E|nr:titin [Drosophila elegans]